jgi:hypothetical protein
LNWSPSQQETDDAQEQVQRGTDRNASTNTCSRACQRPRHILELWRVDDNTQRPHTSLDGLSPFTFANRSPWARTLTDSGYDRGQQRGKVRARSIGDAPARRCRRRRRQQIAANMAPSYTSDACGRPALWINPESIASDRKRCRRPPKRANLEALFATSRHVVHPKRDISETASWLMAAMTSGACCGIVHSPDYDAPLWRPGVASLPDR